MQFTRLGWLLRQAKPSLHGSSGRTRSKCHWAWNDKSTIRIPELPLHNTNLDCNEKAGALPTTLQLHFRALLVAGSCSKFVILAQPLEV